MSLKTKKRFKNLGKTIGIGLFTLLMLTNIKFALMDDSEIASGDISVLGIEIQLFDVTYGEIPGFCNIPCYYDEWRGECTVVGCAEYCIGAKGCPAEIVCRYTYS